MKRQAIAGLLVAATVILYGCGSHAPRSASDADLDALTKALSYHRTVPDVALSGDLGSRGNPVRTNGVPGQREYLSRLRCRNGLPPMFERIGQAGIGPYGKVLDAYRLECEREEPRTVYLDLYHCVEEQDAINGYDIVERKQPRKLERCESELP
ncbi:MAG TPA: hypothetical protein PKZ76_02330 [Xanthomonadaceae bacterium]|nr:hypothetical protein [Xanthomonadaceae bacterium]